MTACETIAWKEHRRFLASLALVQRHHGSQTGIKCFTQDRELAGMSPNDRSHMNERSPIEYYTAKYFILMVSIIDINDRDRKCRKCEVRGIN